MRDAADPPFQIRTPAQAEALLDFTYGARLLEQFLTPGTPSQAAHALKEPANRVTYHVRKLADAGLLRVAGRQGKRVLYETVARTFHVPRALVSLDEPLTLIEPIMREVTRTYAHAIYEHHARQVANADHDDDRNLMVALTLRCEEERDEVRITRQHVRYPPAMRVRTAQLTHEQYARAQAALDEILSGLATEEADGTKKTTFVVMSFPGALHDP